MGKRVVELHYERKQFCGDSKKIPEGALMLGFIPVRLIITLSTEFY